MAAPHSDFHDTSAAQPGEPKLLASNYDGIREYDNPMPFWWSAIFWATILFSVPYFVFYHLGAGSTLEASYEAEVGAFTAEQAKALGDLQPDARTILTLVSDPKLKLGAQLMFRSNCSVCHGPEGGGGTGPNLTDDQFINVRAPEDIYRILKEGVVARGMPAWDKRFSQSQLVLLASYVASLRGTAPVNAKAPQGTPIPPWPRIEAKPEAAPAGDAST